MSLNYDVTRVNPPVTEKEWDGNFVFGVCTTMMACGIGEMNDVDDARELEVRYTLYARVTQCLIWTKADGTAMYPDFTRWIGIRTNVAYEGRAAWAKRVTEYELNKLTRESQRRAKTETR